MLTIYGDRESGNCYKIYLLLHLLAIPHRWQPVDVVAGDAKRPEFLALNPNGKVPLLEIEPGVCLAESNAILVWLAQDTPYLPQDRLLQARVMQWMFFEQYSHEPNIATTRYYLHFLRDPDRYREELVKRRGPGLHALGVMEQHLAHQPFFVGERFTIADIALYAYTHVADEGGFDLAPFPAIRAWLGRVSNRDRFVAIR